MFKFRSMVADSTSGVSLTRSGDPRITRLGAILRRWKLDELPQLINVLRGDMSIVGPRPHIRTLLGEGLLHEQYLSLRPGVTGAATLRFRHEEQQLPALRGRQLEQHYVASILPQKIRLDLQYARHATLFSDIAMILQTIREVLKAAHGHSKIRLGLFSRVAGPAMIIVLVALLTRPNVAVGRYRRFVPSITRNVTDFVQHDLLGQPTVVIPTTSQTAVWADLKTGLYFCPGANGYGRSRRGKQMPEVEAQREHFQPANRAGCTRLDTAPTREEGTSNDR